MSQTPPVAPDVLPATPSASQPVGFSLTMDTFLAALTPFRTQLVALATNAYGNCVDAAASAASALGFSNTASGFADAAAVQAAAALASANSALAGSGGTASSTTTNTLAYGTFTITVQASKAFVPGMSVKVAYNADPTKWLVGDVTAYNSGTGSLTVFANFLSGAATGSAWTVSVSGPGVSNLGYIKVSDRKASGAAAGSAVAADITQTRTLNTIETNTIAGASLSGNGVTLPAGTYRFRARAPAVQVAVQQAFLWNGTDATYAGVGTVNSNSQPNATDSLISGQFTISGAKAFFIRHYTGSANASGMGQPGSVPGQIEVYTELEFVKVA
jgi:uncharacterized protein (DUF697 family)